MENVYKVLSKEDIIIKLKEMRVDNGKYLPIKWFSFIVLNPEYNPNEFNQDIEDSEHFIDTLKLIFEEIRKPEFDFVWNNTLSNIPSNTERWLKNHSKVCKEKLLALKFLGSCVEHEDGVRDYNSEEILEKIMKIPNILYIS